MTSGMTKRKVLIPLDGSEFSRQIVRVVKSFFDPEEVRLILFRAVYPPTPAVGSSPHDHLVAHSALGGAYGGYSRALDNEFLNLSKERETFRVEMQDALRREAERLAKEGYDVTTEVHFGDPAERIVAYVQDMDIDLVAMATHGRTGLGRLILGSVAERVLRTVGTPVLLMRTAVEEQTQKLPGEELAAHLGDSRQLRIVAATDGSSFAQRAASRAIELARILHGKLTLLVSVSEYEGAAHAQKIMQDVYQLVEELMPRPEIVPLVGYTDEMILHYLAKNPADLLCIGAFQDRGASTTTAIGPTAQRMVQHAPISVMMFKSARPTLRKILACVTMDDSLALGVPHSSLPILEVAAQLAKAHNAELNVLHVVPPAAANYLSGLTFSEIDPASLLALEDVLAQNTNLSAHLHNWIEQLECHGIQQDVILLRRGTVPEAILKTAQAENHDLIIVGSQAGYGHFLGSVANGVVRYAEQSVLVVRTRGS